MPQLNETARRNGAGAGKAGGREQGEPMEKAKVYFADLRADDDENLQTKLERLVRTAGIGNIDFKRKYAAIKMHFGELGNLAFLRPNFAWTVVNAIKDLGGKPFLTDSNTLYVGGRKNALDHLETAYLNGFSPFSTSCHIIIADGLKGTDEIEVPVPGGELVAKAKIGRAIMDADVLVSLTHFKCHEQTGIGGVLKNIGMGCGSRAGKMDMHGAGAAEVDGECIGCGKCLMVCAHNALVLDGGKAHIDPGRCIGCGRCLTNCPVDAISSVDRQNFDILNKKIVEYAAAALHGRPHFHISLVMDVSPYCDCHSANDVPIVANIGMFASPDPVALDAACADAVNRQPPFPGSLLEGWAGRGADHFSSVTPGTNWRVGIEHAAKLGVGNPEYELIVI